MLDIVFQVAMALGVLAVGLLAAYGALSFAWTDLKAWGGYLASQGWPETVGRITHSTIKVHRVRRGAVYEPEVQYTYAIEGQSYTGDRLTFHSWAEWLFYEDVRRALEPYQPGAPAMVRYDPRRPESSVLMRRAPRGPISSCFVVVLLLGTSALCLATGLIGLFEGG